MALGSDPQRERFNLARALAPRMKDPFARKRFNLLYAEKLANEYQNEGKISKKILTR